MHDLHVLLRYGAKLFMDGAKVLVLVLKGREVACELVVFVVELFVLVDEFLMRRLFMLELADKRSVGVSLFGELTYELGIGLLALPELAHGLLRICHKLCNIVELLRI